MKPYQRSTYIYENDDDDDWDDPAANWGSALIAIILVAWLAFMGFAVYEGLHQDVARPPLTTLQILTTSGGVEFEEPPILVVPNVGPPVMPDPLPPPAPHRRHESSRAVPVFPRDSQFQARWKQE